MYILSKSQKLIYDMEQYAGGSIAIICGSMLLPGKRDLPELAAAVNELYRINPALRIHIKGNEQVVQDYEEQSVEALQFGSKAELDDYANAYAQIPLDLHGRLSEIRAVFLPGQYGFLIKLHHIIGDAWTLALLGTQVNTLLSGGTPRAFSYVDHLQDEAAYIQSERYQTDRAFFLQQFQKCQEVTFLSDKQVSSFESKRKTFVIESADAERINTYANARGVSPFVLFFSALAAYISRVKQNAEKFYLGTAVINRTGIREKNTAGMFVNTVPVLVELDNEKPFADNLKVIQANMFGVLRHQKFHYGDILSAIRETYGFSGKLYDVMLSYQNASISCMGEEESTWYHCGAQTESLQIHIDDRDREHVFRIHYDYQTSKFTAGEVEALHEHILRLLFSAITDDSKRLYELPMLLPEEEQRLLHDFNHTFVDYPKDKCVHTLFEEQVARTPDKVAVIFRNYSITYSGLNLLVQDYAKKLVTLHVGRNDIVAIHLKRSYKLIVFQLAVLKIGAIFLPVDNRYPADRIQYMCDDCKVKLLVSDDYLDAALHAKVILIQQFEKIDSKAEIPPENNLGPCYIIYTSGSTGRPKGCVLTGSGLANFCMNNNTLEVLRKSKENTFACVNSVSFDYFIAESLLPLTNGYTTVVFDEEESTIQERFLCVLRNNNVNVVMTTPTRLKLYFSEQEVTDALQQLTCICTSGEPLSSDLLTCMYSEAPYAQVYNPLGPSECSVWDIGGKLKKSDGIDIHIGKPIANTQAYIVDNYFNPVPIGVIGELCVAGDCVGAGYLNRPDLTAEKFIPNPFGKGKLYRTGDLAYWREDGNIVYVGRNDFQVKIRGLRIELGEIENALCSVDGISQAVVVVRKTNEGRQLICAFYTGDELNAKEIRARIGRSLPGYMLPHSIVHLDTLPLTSSGKINRRALPEVDLSLCADSAEYVPPRGERQKALCNLMEKVLSVSPIGVTDNFFDLGGDSLKAIEFVSKAHSEGIYFNLQGVFDHPSVDELCRFIEQGDRPVHSFAGRDYAAVNEILRKNVLENISVPNPEHIGNILLAGATGYLGIHILADFLDNDDGIAYCLVRGGDAEQSRKRLQELLSFYFGEKYSKMSRIEVVCADLQQDLFGLPQKDYDALAGAVDTVINAAASVKHYGSYQYFNESNVESVKRLIAFCNLSDAKLIHISTLSVSGNAFGDDFDGYISKTEKHFYESSLYIGQPLENVYARSKFEAEMAVLDAMSNGLRANIMRMGFLSNRFSDGVFQKNYETNAALRRITAILELGCVPDYLMDMYVEFTPIDEAASAVMTIARHFSSEQTVFHINSTKVVYMKRLLECLKELGYSLKVVSGGDFAAALRETQKKPETEHIFETFINDMDENEHLNYDSNIRIENDYTVQYLKNLGFEWSDIDLPYLKKYADYFKKIGYWK